MMRRITLLLLLTFMIISCTENPFSNPDDNTIGKEKISGYIKLNDAAQLDGIYVWLKQFDLATYTNEDGKFTLTLPLPENQSLDGPYSGNVKLYFYLDNYTMDSVECELFNGEFATEQENWSSKGVMTKEVTLEKFVQYKLYSVNGYHDMYDDYKVSLTENKLYLTFVATSLYRFQTIKSYHIPGISDDDRYEKSNLTGLIFTPDNDDNPTLFDLNSGYTPISYKMEPLNPYWYNYIVDLSKLPLKRDTYLISPYFMIEREIPAELKAKLDEIKGFGESYSTKFPIKAEIVKVKFE